VLKKIKISIVIGCLFFIFSFLFHPVDNSGILSTLQKFLPFNALNTLFVEFCYYYKKVRPLHPKIIVVGIDDFTIATLKKRFPYDRKIFAQVIEKISSYNPAIIGVDIVFDAKTAFESDKALVNALKQAGNVILADYTRQKVFDNQFCGIESEFKKAALSIGYIDVHKDEAGYVTVLPQYPLKSKKSINSRSFAYEVVFNYFKKIKKRRINLPNSIIINYKNPGLSLSPTQNVKGISALLASSIHYHFCNFVDYSGNQFKSVPELFKDKIVLIGPTSKQLQDIIKCFPISGKPTYLYGVYVHANAIDNLLTKSYFAKINPWITRLFSLTTGFIGGLSFLTFSGLYATLSFFILATIIVLTGLVLFFKLQLFIFPGFNVLLCLIVLFAVIMSIRFMHELKERQKLKNIFAKYVGDNVLSQILKDFEENNLYGRKVYASILIADIRAFTSFSEKTPPEQTVKVLNLYFDKMTEVIFKYNGTLDKFMGDAMLCIFGAPIEMSEPEQAACDAAIEMQIILKEMNKENIVNFKMGTGIASGEVVVGNIGSKKRLEFTAIGDPVNLSARLEKLTKEYGVNIIIDEATYSKLNLNKIEKKIHSIKKLEKISVRGKEAPVTLYGIKL